MGRAEILAPCGSPEVLESALKTGCDAVYLGGEAFSARQNATNFSREELEQAVRSCHLRGVKVYQAINTVICDRQLDELADELEFACKIGVDGLIIQDLAVAELVRECCPKLELHASTQMTLHTERGVMLASQLGFSRAVVSRELPKEIISQLCRLPIEIEAFVHGALCMSVSGQCFMSGVIGSRSANRGLCAQACRLPVTAIKNQGDRHDLSLKDMSFVKHIQELEAMGVSSLKIEGRMKRPEYVAVAVDSVRKARDGQAYDYSLLEKVFSRGGLTDGYYTGKIGREMFGFRQKEDVAFSAEAIPKIHELYRREYKRSRLSLWVKMKRGEPFYVRGEDENGLTAEVRGEIPLEARNKPTDREALEKQFSKLGDTIYSLKSLEAETDRGLVVPASQLNAMRRELCGAMDKKRCEFYGNTQRFEAKKFEIAKPEFCSKPKIRVSAVKGCQLENLPIDKIQLVSVPLELAEKLLEQGFPKQRLGAEMPRFTFDEKRDFECLKGLAEKGLEHIVCTNYAHISMGRELGLEMHGGFGLNVTNSLALRGLKGLGLKDCTASFELKCGQINSLGGELDFGIIGYGRLPLMLTVNCPISQAVGCKNCTHAIWDRTGREFPVRCSKTRGYVEVLNSDLLYIGDKLNDFRTPKFVQLNFYDETATQANSAVECLMNGSKLPNAGITRGLYYRGVL